MRSLVETAESVRIALAAIRTNKARGTLTTLGIIIGIIGVVTTMTAANGLTQNFKNSVSALGSDVLYVSRMPWIMRGNWFEFRNRPNLSLKESEELERRLVAAVAVNPTSHTDKKVKFQSTVLDNVSVIGTTEKQMMVSASVPELGRFLDRRRGRGQEAGLHHRLGDPRPPVRHRRPDQQEDQDRPPRASGWSG